MGGGVYLRAPNIYHLIRDNYAHRLVRLANLTGIRMGMITGRNAFFYLTKTAAQQWEIEPKFLVRVMTSPRESLSVSTSPTLLPMLLFKCHEDRSKLKGTMALEYINWGESKGFNKGPVLAAKKHNWYKIKDHGPAPLAVNRFVGKTALTRMADPQIRFDCSFIEFRPIREEITTQLCVILNSTLNHLFMEPLGRANFGGGALEIKNYDLQRLMIVNPKELNLKEFEATIFETQDWDILNPSPARKIIDSMVFDTLGLTQAERDGVYEGVYSMVRNRIKKSKKATQ